MERQTGEWKLHQVLLILRYSLVQRKSVSCRLLAGRTHWEHLSTLPCSCDLHKPPGSSILGQGALWCGLVQPPLLGLFGVTQAGRFQWASEKGNGLPAKKEIFLPLNILLWSKSFGWTNNPCLSLCNPIAFGSIFPEIWIHSRVVIQSWKGWEEPRDHLIHSFALIQD